MAKKLSIPDMFAETVKRFEQISRQRSLVLPFWVKVDWLRQKFDLIFY